MLTRGKQRIRFLAMGGLLLLAAGCDRGERAPEPTPSPIASDEVPKASIIRPDIEKPEAEPPPLAPLDARISFADGGAELSETAQADLATLVSSPQVKAGGAIVLRAHTDSGGSDEVNMRASKERGAAVRDWMVENGVDEDRITLIPFGEQNPIAPNANPDGTPDERGRAANRRVEVHVDVEKKREPTMAEEAGEMIEPTAASASPPAEPAQDEANP